MEHYNRIKEVLDERGIKYKWRNLGSRCSSALRGFWRLGFVSCWWRS